MPEPYDTQWYATRGAELGTHGRCPYANVHSCPRHYESLSLLGEVGVTSAIPKDTDQLLHEKWKESKLWPIVVENATSVVGNRFYKNFCPEVSFNAFRQFASDLTQHGDSIDRDAAYRALEREGNVSPSDWRWEWLRLVPQHFAECPLYAQLKVTAPVAPPAKVEEIVVMKPGAFGFSVDLKKLLDRLARWWLARGNTNP